jgi:hypothetical protein
MTFACGAAAQTISVSLEELAIRYHSNLGELSYALPVEEIQGVGLSQFEPDGRPRYRPGRAIIVAGRDNAAAFGGHLPLEEKEWIVAAIEHVVMSGGTPRSEGTDSHSASR